MKFTDKYEVLQKVATGTVETFLVRDHATGQKVVVHAFECHHRTEEPLSMRSVLNQFNAMVAEPVGSVIDAGVFDGTTFGYLVVQWPGDDALREWVRAYEASLRDSRRFQGPSGATAVFGTEQGITPPKSDLGVGKDTLPIANGDESSAPTEVFLADRREPRGSPPGPRVEQTPSVPADLSGFFTWSAEASPSVPPAMPPAQPTELTRRFLSGSGGDATIIDEAVVTDAKAPDASSQITGGSPSRDFSQAASQEREASSATFLPSRETQDLPAPKVSAPLMEAVEAGQFTNLFFKSLEPRERVESRDLHVTSPKGSLDAGEFTSFFQGPFSGERAAAVPKVPAVSAPQEKPPGEFTRIFGSSEGISSANRQVSKSPVAPAATAGPLNSSTEIFAAPSVPSSKSPPASDWQPALPVERAAPLAPSELVFSPPGNVASQESGPDPHSQPGATADRDHPLVSPAVASANATRVFARQDLGQSQEQPLESAGPSPWTIFQRGERSGPVAPEEPPVQSDAKRPVFDDVAAGVAGQMAPAVPSWQAPAAPLPPPAQVAYSMPQPSIPAPPAVPLVPPQTPQPIQSSVSYWPLIIALNVLFIIAVLIVLYFALKH